MTYRMTHHTCVVLAEFMKNPAEERYGRQIQLATGVLPGTLYPLLRRMADHGWLTERWERRTLASREARPPRRYYRITRLGVEQAREVLDVPAGQ